MDYQSTLLNVGSIAVMTKTFVTEDLKLDLENMDINTVGGLMVAVSFVVLNFAKAYKEIKSNKEKKKEE